MENLENLNLSHNEINDINDYLDLTSLVKLDVSHNCIYQMEDLDTEDVSKYMPNLR